MTTSNLDAAQLWLDRGQAVIPLSAVTKSPAVSGFAAHVDDDTIAERFRTDQPWRKRPGCHVGLLCGRGPEPLVVLDLDVLKAGEPEPDGAYAGCRHGSDVVERLAAEHGHPWPHTYSVLTPSGGLHLLYEATPGTIGVRTRALPLLDTRDRGGYAIAAGSTGRAGAYQWDPDSPQRPVPLPEWLAAALQPPKRPPARALPRADTPTVGDRAEKYALAALHGAHNDLAAARDGRKMLLYARARRLAELSPTAPNILTDCAIEAELYDAAVASGVDLDERAIRARIHGGLRAGHNDRSTT